MTHSETRFKPDTCKQRKAVPSPTALSDSIPLTPAPRQDALLFLLSTASQRNVTPKASMFGQRPRSSARSCGLESPMIMQVVLVTSSSPRKHRYSTVGQLVRNLMSPRVVRFVRPFRLTSVKFVCQRSTGCTEETGRCE